MSRKSKYEIPQTAEQVNVSQVGKVDSLILEPMVSTGRIAITKSNDTAATIGSGCELLAVADMLDAFSGLRKIRDSKAYLTDGSNAHSFREWCVIKFGEGIGTWLEERL